MAEILFYHLERGRLEDVLPGLLEKTRERGWRAIVRTCDEARVEHLDDVLWSYRDESFLPHGRNAEQPIWITDSNDANGAEILFLVDGVVTKPALLDAFTRCVMIFDGRNDDALREARGFWKSVKDALLDATYWKQSPEGRWQKQVAS